MIKHKQQEQPDRHLEAPAEANRDKHINFLKEEEESARREESPVFMRGNAPLKKRRKGTNRSGKE